MGVTLVVFGPILKKKQELAGVTRFINKASILYRRLLGTSAVLQVQSKFRRSELMQSNGKIMPSISTGPGGLVDQGAGLLP
jgi:hypothetical protein